MLRNLLVSSSPVVPVLYVDYVATTLFRHGIATVARRRMLEGVGSFLLLRIAHTEGQGTVCSEVKVQRGSARFYFVGPIQREIAKRGSGTPFAHEPVSSARAAHPPCMACALRVCMCMRCSSTWVPGTSASRLLHVLHMHVSQHNQYMSFYSIVLPTRYLYMNI